MRKMLALLLALALVSMMPAALQAAAKQQTGGVNGTALGADKNPLAKVTVQLRDAQGQLVGTSTSSATGEFSFAGIAPGNFTIEIVDAAGNILGTASVTVTAGVVTSVAVTATALGAAAVAAGTAGGLAGLLSGTSLLVISAATAAGITIAVVATRPPASPSR